MKKQKVIGVYKITSPLGKIYIGQSKDISGRFKMYQRLQCERQLLLFESLKEHGVASHLFEIVCECEPEELLNKERHYQELFNCIGDNGLNCLLQKTKEYPSLLRQESIIKRSKASTGRVFSAESISRMRIAQKDHGFSDAAKDKIRKTLIEKKIQPTDNARRLAALKNNKLVLDCVNGIFYDSIKELCDLSKLPYQSISDRLNGRTRNNTNYIFA